MPDREYTVFTNDPTQPSSAGVDVACDELWQQHGPIKAKSETAAIDTLRGSNPDMKADPDVLYFAVAGFRPRKMIRQIIEKFSLGFADEDQPATTTDQQRLGEGS